MRTSLLIGLALILGGCYGTESLSSSQQYKLVSASARAAVEDLDFAYETGLISDEDFVSMDPVVQSMKSSLARMRAEVLKNDTISTQWYLAETQQMIRRLTTMLIRAKEMSNVNDSGNSDGNRSGVGRGPGTQPSASRSAGREARPDPRRTGPGGPDERADVRATRLARRAGEAADRREKLAEVMDVSPRPEVEWD